jgi:hypothetical protein
MNGPDVVGINSGSLSWTLIALMGLSALVLALATVAQVVAWIGTAQPGCASYTTSACTSPAQVSTSMTDSGSVSR